MRHMRLMLVATLALATSGQAATNRSGWVADGPPVNCISVNRLRTVRVIDDRTVDFELSGRRVYRNDLPFRCPGINFNRGFRHNSRSAQLCSFNTFTVNSPGASGPACRLGQFQRLKRAPVAATP